MKKELSDDKEARKSKSNADGKESIREIRKMTETMAKRTLLFVWQVSFKINKRQQPNVANNS